MQTASAVENIFDEVTRNVVQETVNRNENFAVKITTMAGCSAVKKLERKIRKCVDCKINYLAHARIM
jgi:hypothetical protein